MVNGQRHEHRDRDRPCERGVRVLRPPVALGGVDESDVHEERVDDAEVRLETVVDDERRHDDARSPGDDHGQAHELAARERLVEQLGECQREEHGDRDDRDHPDDRAADDRPERREGEQPRRSCRTRRSPLSRPLRLISRVELKNMRPAGIDHDPEDQKERGGDPGQRPEPDRRARLPVRGRCGQPAPHWSMIRRCAPSCVMNHRCLRMVGRTSRRRPLPGSRPARPPEPCPARAGPGGS